MELEKMLSTWTEDKCIGNVILKHVSTYQYLIDPCAVVHQRGIYCSLFFKNVQYI